MPTQITAQMSQQTPSICLLSKRENLTAISKPQLLILSKKTHSSNCIFNFNWKNIISSLIFYMEVGITSYESFWSYWVTWGSELPAKFSTLTGYSASWVITSADRMQTSKPPATPTSQPLYMLFLWRGYCHVRGEGVKLHVSSPPFGTPGHGGRGGGGKLSPEHVLMFTTLRRWILRSYWQWRHLTPSVKRWLNPECKTWIIFLN